MFLPKKETPDDNFNKNDIPNKLIVVQISRKGYQIDQIYAKKKKEKFLHEPSQLDQPFMIFGQ